jgi:uncharacterized phage protein (TIGR01671 family)
MREILFRGKTKDAKNWVVGSLVNTYDHYTRAQHCFIVDDDYEDHEETEVLPESVGQYTELTDKNGKKIFEGDIAKLYTNGYMPSVDIGTVTIKDGMAGIEYHTDITRKYGWNPYFYRFGDSGEWRDMGASGKITYNFEVIGNIHDNPELLEKEKE